MPYIYIVGDGKKHKYFKIGTCQCTEKDLNKELKSSIPNVCIKLFHDTCNAEQIDKSIKSKYKSMRANNISEWIVGARLDDLIRDIMEMDKALNL